MKTALHIIRWVLIVIISILELLIIIALSYNFFHPHTKGLGDQEVTYVCLGFVMNTVLLVGVIRDTIERRRDSEN